MKKQIHLKLIFFLVLLFCGSFSAPAYTLEKVEKKGPTFKKMYEYHCNNVSDIYEHIPVLYQLSSECSSVVEIGVRSMVSTWGILYGLSDSPYENRSYMGIDLEYPPSAPSIFNFRIASI